MLIAELRMHIYYNSTARPAFCAITYIGQRYRFVPRCRNIYYIKISLLFVHKLGKYRSSNWILLLFLSSQYQYALDTSTGTEDVSLVGFFLPK
jgi:hypothetical protein